MMSRPLTVFPRLTYSGVMNLVALGGAAGDDGDAAAAAAGCGACAATRTPSNKSASRVLDASRASFLRALTEANPVILMTTLLNLQMQATRAKISCGHYRPD